MIARFRSKLTYSNIAASLALFVALGGVAVAAGLPKNSVGPKQLKSNAVTAAKIKNGAVTARKLAHGAVIAGKLGPNSVTPGNLGNGSVTSSKIAANAVIASSIKNGVVTNNKLQNESVSTQKLANGSVTSAKLGPEVAPLLGTLKSGQTLRGVFDVGGNAGAGPAVGDIARGATTYQFPISGNAPAVTVLKKGQTTANCSGIGSGSAPAATVGNLCIYLTEEKNLAETSGLAAENNTRLGFGLVAKAKEAGEYAAYGQWAVTAP
jgi:hypothetical protein